MKITYERLNIDSTILCPISVTKESTTTMLNRFFNLNENKAFWETFLNDYELFYDYDHKSFFYIVRNARLRLRKYFYMPPIYVKLNLLQKEQFGDLEPQHIRYLQKFDYYSNTINEDDSKSYEFDSEFSFMSAYHPHVDSNACACYGRWATQITEAYSNGLVYPFMETIRAYLNDYNGRSTFYSIDPYAFDDKHSLKINNFGTYKEDWLTISSKMEFVYGEQWLMDFCEYKNLNYDMYYKIFLYYQNNDVRMFDNADQLHSVMFNDVLKQYVNDYDEYVHYKYDMTEEEWSVYTEFKEWLKPYTQETINLWLTEFIHHSYSSPIKNGDINAMQYAMGTSIYRLNNMEHLSDKLRPVLERYSAIGVINYLENVLLDDDARRVGSYRQGNMFLLLSTNIKPSQMYESYIKWAEYKIDNDNTSLLMENYSAISKSARMQNQGSFVDTNMELKSIHYDIDWEGIQMDGFRHTWINNYKDHWKEILGLKLVRELNRYCNNMVEDNDLNISNSDKKHLLNIMLNREEIRETTNLKAPKMKDTIRLALVSMLKYHNLGLTGDVYNELVSFLTEQNTEYSMNELVTIMSGIVSNDENNLEEKREKMVDMIYVAIPDFPKDLDDFHDYTMKSWTIILKNAFTHYKINITNKIKELNNVLNNTSRNISQTELFS